MKNKRAFITIAALLLIILGSLLTYLYLNVRKAFLANNEFIPTRVYSNVFKITPPLQKGVIASKLRNLGYNLEEKSETIRFTLHSTQYPEYLIPEDHPTLELYDQPITLQFDGTSGSASLVSIETPNGAQNEIYLEPEFIATLSPKKEGEGGQIREVLRIKDFPKQIPNAVIAAEDHHFYEHIGIEPRGFLRALWNNFRTLSLSQGGSTITQQLVKNLMERRNRNVLLKASELLLAPLLELQFSKDQILERYLNEVFLGQIGPFEVRGFSEGAKYFFGKPVNDLNTGEIALLVGLIKGPSYYNPYKQLERAKTRQRYVLERMLETEKISESEFKEALVHPIRLSQAPTAMNRAPYFVDYVKSELNRLFTGSFSPEEIPELGFQVYTTLDLEMNRIAQETLSKSIPQGLQGALAAYDHNTGEVRALIGGRDYSESNFNRMLNMKRQAGSTFKPFVYLTAFRQTKDPWGQHYTPAYPLLDKAWSWKFSKNQPEWKPKNYEKQYLGWITLRMALAKSINTVAAKVAKQVGLEAVIETAKSLGIQEELTAVPSLSLGSIEVQPMEMLVAYGTIANHGLRFEPKLIRAILNPDGSDYERFDDPLPGKAKIDPGVADLMTDLLQSTFDFGTAASAKALGFDRPAAGKTGTTNDSRDAWFIGYTPQLTALVWVGQDQGVQTQEKDKTKHKPAALTGASTALPIWVQFMNKALLAEPPVPFTESEHLEEMRLDMKSGQKADGRCSEDQVVFEKVIEERAPAESTCLSDYPARAD